MTPSTAATTGEDPGPYPTQAGSNSGYPAAGPMLVKCHAESDIRVDTTNPQHLLGSSKWFVSAEGYNHLLGFYESFDGGRTWPTQGHVPGYEGWTENTDPVGAFDRFGNYYSLILAYQFFYKSDGSHGFSVGGANEPNPVQPAEVVAVSVRRHGATRANDWLTTVGGKPDFIAVTDSKGNEPDKQWITIDTNPNSPRCDTIYAMWVNFNGTGSKPFVATAKALPDGTHTPWSTPLQLPTMSSTSSDTYLLPHVAPNGTVYTPVANFPSAAKRSTGNIGVDVSTDGGRTWQGPLPVVANVVLPPLALANTTFRDGILETFGVGPTLSTKGKYPLYVAWEDASAGVVNVLLSTSQDGGNTWSSPIQVNDNKTGADCFQPNLAVSASGRVSVAFYDRRLAAPASGTAEAAAAGLALDPAQPFGAANYCLNASVQFYDQNLSPLGHNVRLTQHAWDPQLNAPHDKSPTTAETFIGDYFGNVTSGGTNFFTFVSTYDDGSNPQHRQQQVVASVSVP
jgi:hypothetical protein